MQNAKASGAGGVAHLVEGLPALQAQSPRFYPPAHHVMLGMRHT